MRAGALPWGRRCSNAPKGYGRQSGGGKSNAAITLHARPILGIVDTRIKPQAEREAGVERRAQQRRTYRRNQAFGLLMLAAAIVIFWLVRAPRGWAFPAGWWRLW